MTFCKCFTLVIRTILESQDNLVDVRGLVLLTDGHDFEGTDPERTARILSPYGIPVLALPVGGDGTAKDLSVSIDGSTPLAHKKQDFKVKAMIRNSGYMGDRVYQWEGTARCRLL